jgi:hypothetical protein
MSNGSRPGGTRFVRIGTRIFGGYAHDHAHGEEMGMRTIKIREYLLHFVHTDGDLLRR